MDPNILNLATFFEEVAAAIANDPQNGGSEAANLCFLCASLAKAHPSLLPTARRIATTLQPLAGYCEDLQVALAFATHWLDEGEGGGGGGGVEELGEEEVGDLPFPLRAKHVPQSPGQPDLYDLVATWQLDFLRGGGCAPHVREGMEWLKGMKIPRSLQRRKDGAIRSHQNSSIYFITHIPMLATAYGTQPMTGLHDAEVVQLIALLLTWLEQLHPPAPQQTSLSHLVDQNLEVYMEIAYCLLYLGHDAPEELKAYRRYVAERELDLSTDFLAHAPAPHRTARLHYYIVLFTFLLKVPNPTPRPSDRPLLTKGPLGDDFAQLLQMRPRVHNLIVSLHDGTVVVPRQEQSAMQLPRLDWEPVALRIAEAKGVPRSRVLLFPQLAYFRVKMSSGGSTQPHADIFYFAQHTDCMAQMSGRSGVGGGGACSLCGATISRNAKICLRCANGPIALYTAWMSLGNYSSATHSLLEFSRDSDLSYFSPLAIKPPLTGPSARAHRKWLRKEIPLGKEEGEWHHLDAGVEAGDLIIFNCKTIHRALPKRGRRVSVDIRFAILS